jgi:hypothetical protein
MKAIKKRELRGGDKIELKEPFKLRDEVLNWLEGLRVKEAPYGTYKMSMSTEATLFSSCFAVFLRELYNDLKNITPEQKREWIELINSWQDGKTGFYIDPRLKEERLYSRHLTKRHDWGYVTWQSTTFCISALEALGGEIKYPFKFLEEWKNPDKVTLWLESLDWKRGTWAAGNVAMFLGICLITDYNANGDQSAKEAMESFFDWHDNFQDPKTGFWGTNCGTPLHIGLFGAMHQYLLYYYMNRPLRYMEKIVDKTLLIQQPDGLFSPIGGGGGCEDLDATDTLVNMYKRLDYRRDDISKALQRVLVGTLNSQGADGGFPWAKRYRFGIEDWLRIGLSIRKHQNFRYWYYSCKEAVFGQTILWNKPLRPPGWTKKPIPITESYIFPTWFRSLNLALISQVLPKNPYAEIDWKFLNCPGLGYFDKKKDV